MFTTAHAARLPIEDLTLLRASLRTMPIVIGGLAVWSFCLLLML